MPTYEYQCANGHRFELFQRITDRPKTRCPTCGARAARIISGGSGLIFKGSGFYITDYGKDGKGPRKGGDAGAESSGAKADAPGETKPADAPAAKSADGPKESKGDKPEKKSKKAAS